MRSPRRLTGLLACAVLLVASIGCTSSGETRLYVLTPVSGVETPPGGSSARLPAVGLHPVGLPEHLDRPQIVTRAGENMLQLAEFDHWAAPLQENLTRVLAANLSLQVPADRVAVFPWTRDSGIDYEVRVDVTRFEGALGGASLLVARWVVSGPGGKDILATGTSSHTEPAGGSYASLVAAQSRLLAALGRDIATAVAEIHGRASVRR